MDEKTINNAKFGMGIFCGILVMIFILSLLNYGIKRTLSMIRTNIFDEHMLINIIMNVGLIAGFLGVFFFTYVADVEQDIVKINTKIITDDLMQLIAPTLSDESKAELKQKLKEPDLKHEDKMVSDKNKKVTNDAMVVLILMLDIGLTISFIISVIFKHNFIKILGVNLVILTLVALTEFAFVNFIPYKYISADTNYVRHTILTKLRTKFIFDSKKDTR